MKNEIMVNIGYMNFIFDGENAVNDAVSFAETARRTIEDDKDRDISVSITFKKEEE